MPRFWAGHLKRPQQLVRRRLHGQGGGRGWIALMQPCANQLCEWKWFIATCPNGTPDALCEMAAASICFGNTVLKALQCDGRQDHLGQFHICSYKVFRKLTADHKQISCVNFHGAMFWRIVLTASGVHQ